MLTTRRSPSHLARSAALLNLKGDENKETSTVDEDMTDVLPIVIKTKTDETNEMEEPLDLSVMAAATSDYEI